MRIKAPSSPAIVQLINGSLAQSLFGKSQSPSDEGAETGKANYFSTLPREVGSHGGIAQKGCIDSNIHCRTLTSQLHSSKKPTYRYSTSGSKSRHFLEIFVRGIIWHYQEGWICVTKCIMLIEKCYPPLFIRQALQEKTSGHINVSLCLYLLKTIAR